jgi:hypothetical protein
MMIKRHLRAAPPCSRRVRRPQCGGMRRSLVLDRRRRTGEGSASGVIRMKLSINSRCQFDGFVLLDQALTQYLCGGLSSSRRLCY